MLDNPKNDAKSEENSVHDDGNAATSELEETWVVIMCLHCDQSIALQKGLWQQS